MRSCWNSLAGCEFSRRHKTILGEEYKHIWLESRVHIERECKAIVELTETQVPYVSLCSCDRAAKTRQDARADSVASVVVGRSVHLLAAYGSHHAHLERISQRTYCENSNKKVLFANDYSNIIFSRISYRVTVESYMANIGIDVHIIHVLPPTVYAL